MYKNVKEKIKNPKELFSSYSTEQTNRIQLILEANNIKSCKQPMGAGSMMNMYIKSYGAGEEVYVDESDYEKALKLLHTAHILEEGSDTKNEKVTYSKTAIMLARVAIVVFFAGVIITLLLVL